MYVLFMLRCDGEYRYLSFLSPWLELFLGIVLYSGLLVAFQFLYKLMNELIRHIYTIFDLRSRCYPVIIFDLVIADFISIL